MHSHSFDFIILNGAYPVFIAKSSSTNKLNLLFIIRDERNLVNQISRGLFLRAFKESKVFYSENETKVSPLLALEITDSSLEDVFLGFCHKIITSVDNHEKDYGNYHSIINEIENWKDFFSPLPKLTIENTIGLWGELYTIYNSNKTDFVVGCWKGPEGDMIDFRSENFAIEVKTSIENNLHKFSHNQLAALKEHVSSCIYSYNIIKDNIKGMNISELATAVLSKIRNKDYFKYLLRCAGVDLNNVDSESLIRFRLNREVKIIDSRSIPSVLTFEFGVSNIQFQSELGHLSNLNEEFLLEKGLIL
ncbi:PD-(D/E)XK motif protein [Leptospira alexanderi]|uniref:PD-(D/E)XK motif protein n=1 Tax=Leptospira alexanderi TaxID=100053 RepID=UPI000990CADE|nr:PD-(D/E)XK motif protein [Leptospira alexanderi]